MYERGLQALQRRDFAASAEALRNVIERYPDERELLERARLYLKVCERELEPKEPAPKTADEWVYAATVALNAGDEANALRHLQRALTADARHDHAHYMMAVVAAPGAATPAPRSSTSAAPSRSIPRIARSRGRIPSSIRCATTPAFKAALDTPPAEGAVARPQQAAAAASPRPKPRR